MRFQLQSEWPGVSKTTLESFDLRTGAELVETRGHYQHCVAIAYTRAGDLVSAGEDGTVRWWDTERGVSRAVLGDLEGIGHLVVVDRDAIVAARSGHLARCSADLSIRWRSAPTSHIESLCASPDGRWIATGDQRLLRVWEASTGACTFELDIGDVVKGVGYSRDAARLFAMSLDGQICELATDWSRTDDFVAGAAYGWNASFARDRTWMLLGGDTGKLRLYDLEDKRPRVAWTTKVVREQPLEIALGPTGRLALAARGGEGDEDEVVIVDAGSGDVVERLAIESGSVTALAVSPDERGIAVGTSTGAILRFGSA